MVKYVKMMLVPDISLMLSYSFCRFPFMGQAVTGTQSGDGQTLLPQAVAQVLPPVTRHSRAPVPFPECLLVFTARPLVGSSTGSRTLPHSVTSSAEIRYFTVFLRARQVKVKTLAVS